MSLNFAAISPHPPIIIPGIGSQDDLIKVGSTVAAMKKLATIFNEAEIETLIVISPHTLVYPDRFNICGMKKLFGSFAQFNAPEIILEYQNDLELAHEIDIAANSADLKTLLYNNNGEFYELDHGIMVPLYYLSTQQESALKVVPMAYSNLDRAAHFSFGQVLRDVINKHPGRVGVLASGDLSHHLTNSQSKKFDQKLVADLKTNEVQKIMFYDEDFVEEAGECGYRSILILLGLLDGKKVNPEILSYEGPFSVGYLAANYKIN